MKFGSHEAGCWGGDLSAKGKFVFSHCELHSVCIFLMGLNVADDTAICDLGTLGDFVPVDEKQLLVPWIYPSPWKRRPISLDMPFLHFNFSGPFIRFRYSWAFPVLGQITVFALTGCNIRSPFA